MSPLASWSAFLQFIIPAPVLSRSSLDEPLLNLAMGEKEKEIRGKEAGMGWVRQAGQAGRPRGLSPPRLRWPVESVESPWRPSLIASARRPSNEAERSAPRRRCRESHDREIGIRKFGSHIAPRGISSLRHSRKRVDSRRRFRTRITTSGQGGAMFLRPAQYFCRPVQFAPHQRFFLGRKAWARRIPSAQTLSQNRCGRASCSIVEHAAQPALVHW